MPTRTRWVVWLALLASLSMGCQKKQFIRNESIMMDPQLMAGDPAFGDPMASEPRRATFVDRHPLLRKPVEYYEMGGPKKVHRLAAATFIGVPAGVLGEARQIIVGCPPGF